MANKDIKADELEKYLNEADEELAEEAEEKELEREDVEETPKEVSEDELSEPELTEDDKVEIEPQDLPEESEEEEEPELPEEKEMEQETVEEEEPAEEEELPKEEEEEIEVEEKSKEEFEEEMEKEIEAEEESKPEEPKEEKDRELTGLEKISCENLAIMNNYFIGITAIEYAFFVTLNMLLSAIVVIKTEMTGFLETTKSLLIQGLECFAFTIVLFLVASLFNNILKQREGKLGLTILFLAELILLGCFLAQIIAVARAVLII